MSEKSDLQLLKDAFPKVEFTRFDGRYKTNEDLIAFRRANPENQYLEDTHGNIIGLIGRNNEHVRSVAFPVLASLQYLNLSDNPNLTSIEFEGSFRNLVHFDISDSKLKSLTFESGFHHLKWLDASRNHLEKMEFGGDMRKLEYLDLSENQLTAFTLPNEFKFLKYLYFNKNKLETFQAASNLRNLEILHLAENNLKELPKAKYTRLQSLNVKGNPLSDYQESLIQGDESGNATEIIGLLRAISKTGKESNYHAKLIVVGNGRIGKTCMVCRLKGEKYPENEPYTHGISIREMYKKDLLNIKTEELELKVWDFGGQEVFYATHQFFLSEEAAYIYVWTDKNIAEANREKDLIKSPQQKHDRWRNHEYWLNNIRTHGKHSPILVVKSHSLDARESFPFERLKENFELKYNPLDFDASSTDTRNLENLKTSLTEILNSLPLLGSPFPKSYYNVINDISELRSNGTTEMTKDDFIEMALKREIILGDMDLLLNYLIKTGEIIHFPDNKLLENRIFIDPEFLTGLIYKLIENNDYLDENDGIFSKEYAVSALEDEWESLMELLISFELVFKREIKGKITFVAPQYLKNTNQSVNIHETFEGYKEERTLLFELRYPRFMPENVMINVLSKYGPYSRGAVYKNAIYFIKENTTFGCLIESDEETRTVKVYTGREKVAQIVGKDVYEKFLSLSKKAILTISTNGGQHWVNCKGLEEALKNNYPLQNTEDNYLKDSSGFEFLNYHAFSKEKTEKEKASRRLVKRDFPQEESNIIERDMAENARDFIGFKNIEEQIKILFLAATPMSQGQLDTGSESRFEDLIQFFDKENRFKVKQKHGLDSKKFKRFLIFEDPHIVHYGGHGEAEGIVLNDKELSGDTLVKILKLSKKTQCVILNACYSVKIAKKIAEHIPYVIATQNAIDDRTAITFAQGFYMGIVAGRSVEDAFELGIIEAEDEKCHDTDVLILVKGTKKLK